MLSTRRALAALLGACSVAAVLIAASPAEAVTNPAATLSPTSGPPTTATTVTLVGFGAFEAVDVYVDTTDVALVSANSTGAASTTVAVAASAAPGAHSITAVGRHSGYSAQAAFTVRTNWSQYGNGAAHRDVNPYENRLSGSTVGNLTQEWRVTGHLSSFGKAEPAVYNGFVYEGFGDGAVISANADTGSVRWTRTLGGPVQSSPAVAGTTVFVGSDDHYLYALSTTNGTVKWRAQTGGLVQSSPAVAGTTVVVGSLDGTVYAYDTATGNIKWSYITSGGIYASPTVVNGVVYVGSQDGREYALSATDGSLVWQSDPIGQITATAAVVNGRVYVGSTNHSVYALRTATGAVAWSYATGGIVEGVPLVTGSRAYVGSDDGKLYILDAGTGSLVQSPQLATMDLSGNPVFANGVIYLCTGGATEALSTSGTVLGDIPACAGYGAPVVTDGAVYLLDFNDQQLVKYDLGPGPMTARPSAGSLHPDPALRAR